MQIEARVVGYGKLDPNEHVSLEHVQIDGADYSGRKLKHFGSVGCRFERCRFDKCRIDSFVTDAGMELSEYIDCSFDGIKVYRMSCGYARFVRCSFRSMDIRRWKWCEAMDLIDCEFTGRLKECIFNGTVPEKDRAWVGRETNEFRGNDFSGCDLVDVAFRTGIDLSQQRLPTRPEYLYLPSAALTIERARNAVHGWYEPKLREEGLTFLGSLESELEGGQRQLLIRADDYVGYNTGRREMIDGVFAALRTG